MHLVDDGILRVSEGHVAILLPSRWIGFLRIENHASWRIDCYRSGIRIDGFQRRAMHSHRVEVVPVPQITGNLAMPCAIGSWQHLNLPPQRTGLTIEQ